MPLRAQRSLRKMRGGAQAHLVEASDGHFYVVKFRNNPQHRRILVNEWVAGVFLRYLQLSSPRNALISVSEEFLQENPGVYIQLGRERRAVEPGWHFGSRYPGDPATLAVFDFLPDALLSKVENLSDFLGMMVFDKWMANADSRQSVFFRARLKEWMSGAAHPLRVGFVTLMIDHGFVFNGPNWEFPDAPLHGLYFRPTVYERVKSLDQFQPWLDRVVSMPASVFDEALRETPQDWLEEDAGALEGLMETLYRRRSRVADLLSECRRSKPALFPHWT